MHGCGHIDMNQRRCRRRIFGSRGPEGVQGEEVSGSGRVLEVADQPR